MLGTNIGTTPLRALLMLKKELAVGVYHTYMYIKIEKVIYINLHIIMLEKGEKTTLSG